MYMPNARNLRLGPNATYIPLTGVGVLRETQISGLVSGVKQIFAFLNNNMLVHLTQNCGIWGSKPMQGPKANRFAPQWNIGFRVPVVNIVLRTDMGGLGSIYKILNYSTTTAASVS